MAQVISFFTDVPVMHHKGRCLRGPTYPNLFDTLGDQMDQRIGNAFRCLPNLLTEMQHNRAFDVQPKHQQQRTSPSRQTSQAVVSTENGQFHIKLNTTGFSPEELMVKVVGDKIHVSGKRESKSNDCYDYQEMQRVFSVPDGVDPNAIASKLSKTGELIIEAPMKTTQNSSAGRNVPIQRELENGRNERIQNGEESTKHVE